MNYMHVLEVEVNLAVKNDFCKTVKPKLVEGRKTASSMFQTK